MRPQLSSVEEEVRVEAEMMVNGLMQSTGVEACKVGRDCVLAAVGTEPDG